MSLYSLPPGWAAIRIQVSLFDNIEPRIDYLLPPAYQLGTRKKQADAGVEPIPNPSGIPGIVLEVGSSESLAQLEVDVRLWLEDMPMVG